MRSVSIMLTISVIIACLPTKSDAQVIVLDNNDNAIGILLNGPYFEDQTEDFEIATENSYLFEMIGPRLNGETVANSGYLNQRTLFFESGDCSGQGYMVTHAPGMLFSPFSGRNIDGPEPEAWYVPKNEQISYSRVLNSSRDSNDPSGCREFTIPQEGRPTGRAFPNDPIETGFTDPTPPWPFKFRTVLDPDLVRCIFRDSFECEA